VSSCTCSGHNRKNWDDHSDYCYVYMQGFIMQLEEKIQTQRENIARSIKVNTGQHKLITHLEGEQKFLEGIVRNGYPARRSADEVKQEGSYWLHDRESVYMVYVYVNGDGVLVIDSIPIVDDLYGNGGYYGPLVAPTIVL